MIKSTIFFNCCQFLTSVAFRHHSIYCRGWFTRTTQALAQALAQAQAQEKIRVNRGDASTSVSLVLFSYTCACACLLRFTRTLSCACACAYACVVRGNQPSLLIKNFPERVYVCVRACV